MVNKQCLICAGSIAETSSRLGIEACRSCAAFFKRTKIANRKFTCRQEERFMCRRCRFDKCLQFGMELEPHVRNPRKKLDSTPVDPEIPSTSSKPSDKLEDSLLKRMEAEYEESCERRMVLEREYIVKHNLKPLSHPTKEVYIANFSAFYDLYRITVKESASLIRNVFVNFNSFPIYIRVALFKNFAVKFSMVEGIYFTAKYFKDSTKFASSLLSCADTRKLDEWQTDDLQVSKNGTFLSSVRGFSQEYLKLFNPMAKMSQLTEREFYALALLCYCDIDGSLQLPDDITHSIHETRTRIFDELQAYYRNELNLHDFSCRLGNLMTLAHGAGEAGKLMNEEMLMYSAMFDLYSDDALFRELFTE